MAALRLPLVKQRKLTRKFVCRRRCGRDKLPDWSHLSDKIEVHVGALNKRRACIAIVDGEVESCAINGARVGYVKSVDASLHEKNSVDYFIDKDAQPQVEPVPHERFKRLVPVRQV